MPDSNQFLIISQSTDITLSQEINLKTMTLDYQCSISFFSQAPTFVSHQKDHVGYKSLTASYIPILVPTTVTN